VKEECLLWLTTAAPQHAPPTNPQTLAAVGGPLHTAIGGGARARTGTRRPLFSLSPSTSNTSSLHLPRVDCGEERVKPP